ncbi:MAG: LysR family transcriptional regulator [Sarcina sp.]
MVKKIELEYFKKLASIKNFCKTAEFFFVSQSVISKAVQELEKNFDAKLIVRKQFSRAVELTEEGNILLQGIQYINLELDNLQEDLIDFKEKEFLRIGLPFLGDNAQLKKYLDIFLKDTASEQFRVELIEDTMVNLQKKLQNEELDYVFSYYLEKKKSLKNVHSIDFNDMYTSIYSIKERFPKHNIEDLDILNNQVLISLKDGTMHARLIKLFLKKYKIKPKKIVYVDTFTLLKKLISEGYGCTVFASQTFSKTEGIYEFQLKEKIYLKTCIEYTQQKKFSKIDQKLIKSLKNFNNLGDE